MHGVVKVGLEVTVPSESKRVVRWSTVRGAGATTFDVQMRIGSRPWQAFRTDTVKPKAAIKASGDAPVKVRARTSTGSAVSGWSKPVTLTFA
jgi:hypothetical protein